jgi:hypothetical protein
MTSLEFLAGSAGAGVVSSSFWNGIAPSGEREFANVHTTLFKFVGLEELERTHTTKTA